MIVCKAPGKVMLAGEYAVIDGSSAIMLAVDRFAVASIHDRPQHLSPFLQAVHHVLAEEFGKESPQAQRALRVKVDTEAFREDGQKLGLGSSAAATVAAVGAAISDAFDVERVHVLARKAHGDAQAPSGARGSGADVASSCFGSCLRFSTVPKHSPIALPSDLHLVFPWCGQSASTTKLVPHVRALRAKRPAEYERICASIADSAEMLGTAGDAEGAIAAIEIAGRAVAELGRAAGADLWLPIHSEMREVAGSLGGAVKPTGAGGGDLALAAFGSAGAAQTFRQRLAEQGIQCPSLAPAHQGVRLQSQPSKVGE